MRLLLTRLAEGAEVTGVTVATLIIFAPSMIALAATGPILVRLCAGAGRVGRAAGLVYALSTLGSMAGILVTIFWLIPTAGTETTLRSLCVISFLMAATGIREPTVALAIVPIAFLPFLPRLGWAEGSVWTAESSYNLVRVIQNGTQWLLQLNHPASIHTIRDASGIWTGYYYDHFALGPLLVPTRRALVLGMGAGSSVRSMRITAPDAIVDAVEIDPKVVEAATRWFGVDATDPRLNIHVADARRWMSSNRATYDLVQLDIYQGNPYIPFYLVTEEFFRLTRSRMNDNALLMMNVFDAGTEPKLLFALAATLRRVFPSVMVGQTSPGNSMLFAFTRVRSEEWVRARVISARFGRLRDLQIRNVAAPAATPVFTDNLAPVEQMTRRMLSGR